MSKVNNSIYYNPVPALKDNKLDHPRKSKALEGRFELSETARKYIDLIKLSWQSIEKEAHGMVMSERSVSSTTKMSPIQSTNIINRAAEIDFAHYQNSLKKIIGYVQHSISRFIDKGIDLYPEIYYSKFESKKYAHNVNSYSSSAFNAEGFEQLNQYYNERMEKVYRIFVQNCAQIDSVTQQCAVSLSQTHDTYEDVRRAACFKLSSATDLNSNAERNRTNILKWSKIVQKDSTDFIESASKFKEYMIGLGFKMMNFYPDDLQKIEHLVSQILLIKGQKEKIHDMVVKEIYKPPIELELATNIEM